MTNSSNTMNKYHKIGSIWYKHQLKLHILQTKKLDGDSGQL